MSSRTADQLAEDIRSYGTWQGPDGPLDELVARAKERNELLFEAISICNENRWSFGGMETLRALIARFRGERDAALESRDAARRALRKVAEQQPKTIDWLRANGIVFDGPLGTDPKNWEQVAFSIYTDLAEVGTIARTALGEES